MGKPTPYEENHRINQNGEIEKKCNKHYLYFPNESSWLLCTTEYYYKNKSNSIDGLHTWCKRCASLKSSGHWENNKESAKESHKKYEKSLKWREYSKRNHIDQREHKIQYRKENRDKMKEYAKHHRKHDITEQEWQACQNAFNNCCAYCNKTFEEQYNQNHEQFHREHVDDQGYNDLRNCVPACTNCNSKKHKSTIDELLQNNYILEFTLSRYNKIIWWITEGYKKYIENKPPYRILRKKNENSNKYHFELWMVDEKRNLIESVHLTNTLKEMNNYLRSLNKIIS